MRTYSQSIAYFPGNISIFHLPAGTVSAGPAFLLGADIRLADAISAAFSGDLSIGPVLSMPVKPAGVLLN